MPVVPFNPNAQVPSAPQASPPPDDYLLMAAAQMHSEDRLLEKAKDGTKPDNPALSD